jgi:hypothetical protein
VLTKGGYREEQWVGERGRGWVTHLIKKLPKASLKEMSEFSIYTKYDISYKDLSKYNLFVQVWKYNRWSANNLLGSSVTSLLKVVSGSNRREESIR